MAGGVRGLRIQPRRAGGLRQWCAGLGRCGSGEGAAPRWLMVEWVKVEQLREGCGLLAMGGGVGGLRVRQAGRGWWLVAVWRAAAGVNMSRGG
jgi:hypothetical protein